MIQLPLGIGLRDSATFENFHSADNREAMLALSEGREQFIYLWGPRGSGKTHLVQALCQQQADGGSPVAYLPLQEPGLVPEMLQGMESMSLVVIDDIDAVTGQAPWETALFHLYNLMRDAGARLVVTANAAPAALPIALPDLASRLAWGLTLQLSANDDAAKLAILQARAHARGFELPTEVGQFLLKRCERDMESLIQLLEQLDLASLREQRKLTIPFVKTIL
ncbi:MAG: DnaA regulatory inactivator Hda [Gammaproteobacteria bacterium]|nr:DnaA regulatory inactivator Hda [Gammaproteobacteria bacterium]